MKTLQEHLDDLDRMVDTDAGKPQTRSQIAFVGREVAALEADYADLAHRHAELQKAHTQLQDTQRQEELRANERNIQTMDSQFSDNNYLNP